MSDPEDDEPETINCDNCGNQISIDDIWTDEFDNTLCEKCYRERTEKSEE